MVAGPLKVTAVCLNDGKRFTVVVPDDKVDRYEDAARARRDTLSLLHDRCSRLQLTLCGGGGAGEGDAHDGRRRVANNNL